MAQPLDDYFLALQRLTSGNPIRIAKGSKINNDAVALEAGRGKGSIKKSRPVYYDLIQAINAAASEQSKSVNHQKNKLDKIKQESDRYRHELEAALQREVSLLYELYQVKKELALLTGKKILPIRTIS